MVDDRHKTPVTRIDAGDELQIIPLKPVDQWRPLDNIRSLLFLAMRKPLNEDALRDALNQLIRRHLPILGARIELKKSDLEYHLPKSFSSTYQLFDWTNRTISSTLGESDLFPQAHESASGAFFAPVNIPEMEKAWTPSSWPVERKFEKPGAPLLFVHITKYTNATIVALNLPHAVSDQMGFGSMIKAWIRVVAGETPMEFLDLSPSALDGPKLSQKELRKKGEYRILSSREQATKIIPFISDLIFHSKETRKTLFLPVEVVDDLRKRCTDVLKKKYGKETLPLTNADILTGILAKFAHLDHRRPKMLTLNSTINMRGRHPALPANKSYLHNALSFAVSRLPIASNTPLAEVAYKNRLAVTEQLQLKSIERSLAVTKELYKRKYHIHVVEPSDISYAVTNWCGAWRDIDFGPAIIRGEGAAATDENSTAVPLIFGHSLQRNYPTRYNAQIMCKADGGYWCDFTAHIKAMECVERLLKSDPKLQSL
ncbi:BCL5p [Penicillium canariense]|uniref:BCL5p n=1 Tax=Penicillium canariense TaxID=189055 RepID=A0A9W9HZQ0_9EURO|nr:BCL5p [Penicillium canariense]KAJ5160781.1 BCL5p [Penicillium canariense]